MATRPPEPTTDDPAVAVVHGAPVSTWTRTVRMTCIEKGVAHELVLTRPGDAPDHPFGRIPTLRLGHAVLFESLAIVGHLDETGPGAPLRPEDPGARARMRTWMSVCADYLFRDVVRGIPRGRPASEEQRTGARVALERCERLAPAEGFLAGPALSLADLYLAPILANVEDKAPDLLDGLPRLGGWFATVSARRSFRETEYRTGPD